ncbi:FadR/GntR family transcriptional regulator [Mycobacterium colombiense]|uniref:FadR/GntR family transcriptional regulator n=1 Tax=Mycobacterium colombiense TaxID=339268 RepID=UPI00200A2C98|nr:FCD domain-containing protein [Mycobacterium colombiense]MCK8647108.1 FCD domain-containing protein [Mycobacterium colombiense]
MAPLADQLSENAAQSRAERLAAAIEARIIRDDLEPAVFVGTFESLRAESGFAYSTVSAAARLLRDRGLLEIRPGRGGGLFVADPSPVVRLRRTLLQTQTQSVAVADAIELREHLEALIDITAARFRTDRDITDMRDHLARMAAAPSWDAFIQENWALHERIAAICPNSTARAVYLSTFGPLKTARPRIDRDRGIDSYRRRRHRIHVDLVAAIAAGSEARVRRMVARHNAVR